MANTPYRLPAGNPPLPSGEFLLPVCTTRERAGELLNALNFYLVHSGEKNYNAVIDVYRALAYVEEPFMSPCLRGGLNCIDVFPDQSSITYEPQNPFTEPDYTPPGYQAPPFFWVEPADTVLLSLGFQVGDVVTDPTRFMNGQIPIPPDDFGFPRFRFSWSGRAEVELHLLQFPVGGCVLVTQDSDPLSTQVLQLNLDVASIPPETVSEIVIEREINTEGEHYIDVTFFPTLNDELPYFGYGGGFRKITICQGECMSSFDVRQNTASPCKLEKTEDGETWVQFADLRLCKPQIRIGGGGRTEIYDPESDTWTPVEPEPIQPRTGGENDNRCLASANAVNVFVTLHGEVVSRYGIGIPILGIALAFAAAILSILGLWVVAAELVATLGGILLWGGALTMAAFTQQVKDELQCIFYCNSTDNAGVVTFDYEAIKAEIQAKESLADIWKVIRIYLLVLGGDAVDRAGATTAITSAECECTDCPGEWCYRLDFTTSDQGYGVVCGSWVNGQGYTGASGGACSDNLEIESGYLNSTGKITSMTFEFSESWGGQNPLIVVGIRNNLTLYATSQETGLNVQMDTDIQCSPTTYIRMNLDRNSGNALPAGEQFFGSQRLRSIVFRGTGESPFPSDNC